MQPPHHVLSHIEDIVTVGPLHDRHGFDLLHDTDVLVGLCHQLAARCGQFLSRHPFVVGLISGFVPPRQFVEGIVFLTVELVVRDDRPPCRGLPRRVGHDQLLGSVLVLDLQLRQQARHAETADTRVAHREEPPVAEDYADRVVPQSEQFGYVIRVVVHRRRGMCRHRLEDILGNLLAVQVALGRPTGTNVKYSTFHTLLYRKFFAQVTSCQTGEYPLFGSRIAKFLAGIRGSRNTDPLGLPGGGIKQCGRKILGLAPGRAPFVGLHTHAPEIFGSGLQRRSAVSNEQRSVRIDKTRIPQQILSFFQFLGRGRHLNLVGDLVHIGFLGFDLPHKPRMGRSHPDRIFTQFDPQLIHLHFRGRAGESEPRRTNGDKQHFFHKQSGIN